MTTRDSRITQMDDDLVQPEFLPIFKLPPPPSIHRSINDDIQGRLRCPNSSNLLI